MQNIKKIITNYKKTFIVLTITLILLIFISIYCLTNKKEKTNNKVIDSKQITWNQNPSNEKDYNTALEQWKNQCYFKSGNTYTGDEIKNKMGRSERFLYCLDDGHIDHQQFGLDFYIRASANFNYQIDYCYFPGWFYDNIVLKNLNIFRTETNYPPEKICFPVRNSFILFNTYCDTTPPPTKPISYEII